MTFFLFCIGIILGFLLNEAIRWWALYRTVVYKSGDASSFASSSFACSKNGGYGLFSFCNPTCTLRLLYKLVRITNRLPYTTKKTLLREDSKDLAELMSSQLEHSKLRDDSPDRRGEVINYLAVDIGATRTKFKYAEMSYDASYVRVEHLLPPMMSKDAWSVVRGDHASLISSKEGSNVIKEHVEKYGIRLERVNRLVFSVPGTVDLSRVDKDDISVVKNMPSFSQLFRGFDFKKHFSPLCNEQERKVSAIADNLAAAMGAASSSSNKYQNGLVLVLGTAPSVATFYKQTDAMTLGHKDPYIETAIWQSWVWFTKIELKDRFGYCGGIHVRDGGKTITLRDPKSSKIPHGQSRIRFALDGATWSRLLGKNPDLPAECQGNLTEEEATGVWVNRVQSAVNALAIKFHQIYGPPDCIFILGGNSVRCHDRITVAEYIIPDISRPQINRVPVNVLATDEQQQNMHMDGLITSTRYKVKQVFAPGNDPLSRGWTRGGEIYEWIPRHKGDSLLARRNSLRKL